MKTVWIVESDDDGGSIFGVYKTCAAAIASVENEMAENSFTDYKFKYSKSQVVCTVKLRSWDWTLDISEWTVNE